MDSKLQHSDLRSIPQGKDLERLSGMYEHYVALSGQINDAMSITPIVEGVSYLGAIRIVDASASLDFKGLGLCPHCVERASLLLRDLANTLDDIVVEVRKHASK